MINLTCPSCKTNLKPHYHNGSKEPSYHYCQDRRAPYANMPHYKFFSQDGYGYEVFLIWIDAKKGDCYSIKRDFENGNYTKVEISYRVTDTNFPDVQVRKTITRTFSAEDFEFDSADVEGLRKKVTNMVEIAETFL